MKRFFLIIIAVLLLICPEIYSQADISMIRHWDNRASYNPASITRPGYIYLFSDVRNQWVGIDGAPKVINTQASFFSENLSSGFGVSLVADKVGITQALNPTLLYAFRAMDNNENSYSLGLSAGVFSRSLNGTEYEAETVIDPLLIYEINRTIRPDANIGFEFQSRYFTAGISTTHLFSLFYNTSDYLIDNHRYAYLIFKNYDYEALGYQFGLHCVNRSNLFVVEGNAGITFNIPTGLLRGAPERFDLGISYRTTQQLSAYFSFMLTQNLRAGYAYDQSFIPGFLANGTHEIMLEYRIPVYEKKCRTCP